LQQRLNVTVLFVTHDQLEALSLSDTIALMNQGRVEQVGPPRELYESPRSAFVRDFVGQNLLLDGRVVEVLDDGWLDVQVAGLPREARLIARVAPGWRPAPEQPVKLAIRPEDAELVTGGAANDERVLPALTRAALFLGDRYQIQVELSNGAQLPLHAPRAAQRNWTPNAPVGVRVDPDAVMVWPA